MGNILEKDLLHKQIVATDQRLQSEENYDLAENYAWALQKETPLGENTKMIIMKPQNYQQQTNYQKLQIRSKWKRNKTRKYM